MREEFTATCGWGESSGFNEDRFTLGKFIQIMYKIGKGIFILVNQTGNRKNPDKIHGGLNNHWQVQSFSDMAQQFHKSINEVLRKKTVLMIKLKALTVYEIYFKYPIHLKKTWPLPSWMCVPLGTSFFGKETKTNFWRPLSCCNPNSQSQLYLHSEAQLITDLETSFLPTSN